MSDHLLGSKTAPIVLLEYGDYQCEFCMAAEPIVRKLKRHFGSNIAVLFRNFPLTGMHPKALAMACYAESAETKPEFWKRHTELLEGIVPRAGSLQKALKNEPARQKVDADIQAGIHLGVNGTPTFFVNGKRYNGEHEYYAMQEFIQKKLQKLVTATRKK
jgi:protein-disulfide isomerase